MIKGIDDYLKEAERALFELRPQERAEIILKIREEIQGKLNNKSWTEVHAEMGSPYSVAEKYAKEKGYGLRSGTPGRRPPSKSSVAKYLFLGFAIFILFSAFVTYLAFQYISPLVDYDEDTQQLKIFGMNVDEDDVHFSFQFDGGDWGSGNYRVFRRSIPVSDLTGDELFVNFANGKMKFSFEGSKNLEMECQLTGDSTLPELDEGSMTMDFAAFEKTRCKFEVPEGIDISLKGSNGKVMLDDLHQNAKVQMDNGHVRIEPDDDVKYEYDLKLTNGRVDSFKSSLKPDYKIQVEMTNGSISKK